MASQSNLFAAIAWTVINLILYPEYSDAVRKGTAPSTCAHFLSR